MDTKVDFRICTITLHLSPEQLHRNVEHKAESDRSTTVTRNEANRRARVRATKRRLPGSLADAAAAAHSRGAEGSQGYNFTRHSENTISSRMPSCQTPVGLSSCSVLGRALHRQPRVGSPQSQKQILRATGLRHFIHTEVIIAS